MDRVKVYKQLDEASRLADLLSRRLSDAASAVAYGSAPDLTTAEALLRSIEALIDTVKEANT